MVELLGLAPLLERTPSHLSKTERQRLALGSALLGQPRLLLLDDPLIVRDRSAKCEILPFLERILQSLALPMIYISHDITDIDPAGHFKFLRVWSVKFLHPRGRTRDC
ncbi:ATP-binding cassette domain-containing protein, partial [Bradyrhizobium liaoningense]|uniref:ATP-binding cassette domain-containing protein n=1 Tax=Bradyrhizobium liaoningense TaxID=43992 RepID=UPI00289817F3